MEREVKIMQNKLLYRMGTFLFVVGVILLNSIGFQLEIDDAIVITMIELGLTAAIFWNTDSDEKVTEKTKERGDK